MHLTTLKDPKKVFQFILSPSLSPLFPAPVANTSQADGIGVMPQRLTDVNSDGITRGQTAFSLHSDAAHGLPPNK